MQNQLQVFTSNEFGDIGVLMIEGKPFFPATQCAKILGYAKPQNAITRHCPHSLKRGVGVETGRKADGSIATQYVETNFIPEGDLYRLISHSQLPLAQRFESWVFDEVLPSIRKYGVYMTDEVIYNVIHHPDFAFEVLKAMIEEKEKNLVLQKQLDITVPKARYCDEILKTTNNVQTSIIAKDYGMSAVSFNRLLHVLGIQYKMENTWLLYQDYADKGYTKTETIKVSSKKAVIHTYWTQSGRKFLYDFLREYNVMPLMEKQGAKGGK